MKKIIAICGSKRSGKDTLATLICNNFTEFEHVKISSKLKVMCQTLFNFTQDQIESDLKDEIDPRWHITPRKAMQFMGTEIMQYKIQDLLGTSIGREFWINSLIESFDDCRSYIISDLRFHHEYKRIKQMGGVIIKVVDNDMINSDDHISENEFQHFPMVDFIVDNTGRKNDLSPEVFRIMRSLHYLPS